MVLNLGARTFFGRAWRLVAALSLLLGLLAGALGSPGGAAAAPVTQTFDFTGTPQSWVVPAGVTSATFTVYGAQGGSTTNTFGGLGGAAVATLALTPGETVTILVGGQGGAPEPTCTTAQVGVGQGGYNGGGNGGGGRCEGAGGGGASDVRLGGTSDTDRVLVAGGGGGAGGMSATSPCRADGGAGGGDQGGTGRRPLLLACLDGGTGGNQDGTSGSGSLVNGSAGAVGSTNNQTPTGGGGGGGGYYGGAGGPTNGGGGGGSGFGPASTVFQTGFRQGDGQVLVSYTPSPTMVDVSGAAVAGGANVALRAAVTRQSDGTPVPAGTAVTFAYNGNTYNATTDAQGVATATAPLPAGTQPGAYPGAVQASYAGVAGYAASQGQGPLNVAPASCAARFADVQDTDPACLAIYVLADRGVIAGYDTDPPAFGPLNRVQRAQVAAFLVRALQWQNRPQGPRTFTDLGDLAGTDLPTAVRIVANACDSQGNCVAAGYGDGRFGPTGPVTRAEVIAFLTRAFKLDAKYAWADQPGAPQPYTGVPAAFDTNVRTYVYYAGNIPDAPSTADAWNAPASRAWVARVLYQALATKP